MKKLIIASLLSVSFCAAAEIPAAPDDYTTCTDVKCSNYIVNKFNIHPSFFGGKFVYSDTIYASKNFKRERLLFRPSGPVMMFNQTTGELYHNGSDFRVSGDKITIPEGSTIPVAKSGFNKPLKEDKNFNINVTTEYQKYQISASYKKADRLYLKMSGGVTDLRNYVKSLKDMRVTYYGDSITYGANATDIYSEPHQPPYVGLVSAYLSMVKGGKYHYYNPSVPGWTSNNAYYSTDGRLTKLDSDVYIISFGMNDSNDLPPKEYFFSIDALIKNIKSKNKHARIVLLSSTLPNPEWVLPKKEYFPLYSEELKKLSLKYNHVTFVDITNVWVQMLQRKNIYAITGNGANHPADLGHRVIAEALLTAFLGNDFS
ncbi:TPA: SGNH/GDSL hydrolase family protein [Enterobacter bugandensis]|nr:SGNH/GDSL hydrolase family protein [Enterobacter bugandensis]